MKKTVRIICLILGLALGVMVTFKVGGAAGHLSFWQFLLIVPFVTLTYITFVESWKGYGQIVGIILGVLFELIIVYYFILLVIVIGGGILKVLGWFL